MATLAKYCIFRQAWRNAEAIAHDYAAFQAAERGELYEPTKDFKPDNLIARVLGLPITEDSGSE